MPCECLYISTYAFEECAAYHVCLKSPNIALYYAMEAMEASRGSAPLQIQIQTTSRPAGFFRLDFFLFVFSFIFMSCTKQYPTHIVGLQDTKTTVVVSSNSSQNDFYFIALSWTKYCLLSKAWQIKSATKKAHFLRHSFS